MKDISKKCKHKGYTINSICLQCADDVFLKGKKYCKCKKCGNY